MHGKSRKHYENKCLFYFLWTSAEVNLKPITEIETSHANCWKLFSLTFIIASMLIGVIHKIFSNVWKIKKTP